MNTPAFISGQNTYFADCYKQFAAFGGPCVYFHGECLKAGRDAFLSDRHIEMLYATLTAWGLHRMGDTDTTKAKLTDWNRFRNSLRTHHVQLQEFVCYDLLKMSEVEYSHVITRLRPYYEALNLTVSGATVVVNSKALHHLFPQLIPPIDRQYTVRFFGQAPEKWRNGKGRFRGIQLPSGLEAQFAFFQNTCVKMKRLADQIDPGLFEHQRREFGVTAPKALDNAIVSFVRTVSSQTVA